MCQRWVRAGDGTGSFGLPTPRRRRQAQCEGAARAQLRPHGDVSAVLSGQLSGQVEAEAGAGDSAVLGREDAPEPGEEPGNVLVGDAEAFVADGDARMARLIAYHAADLTAPWRVLDRVAQEIHEDGAQPVPVGEDHDLACRPLDLHPVLATEQGTDGV